MIGTRRLVLRQWVALLIATTATLAGAVVAIEMGRQDARALRGGEAPAREGVAAARRSLIRADSEALIRFDAQKDDQEGTDTAGPGRIYRAAVADAGRQLAQVSQAEIGGPAAEAVQVVNGLLITYGGLIELAFRDTVLPHLDLAYLQYAHNFLNEEILPQLAVLESEVDRSRPDAPGAGRHLLWIVPLTVLAGLLGWTQVTLARRFRRTLSAPLLLACLCLAGLAVVAAVLPGAADDDVAAGRTALTALVRDYRRQEADARREGCPALNDMARQWYEESVVCPRARPEDPVSGRDLLLKANGVSTAAQDAVTAGTRGIVLVIVLGVVAMALICAGLWPRFEEYRFRRR